MEEEESLEAQSLMPEERRRARPRDSRKNRQGLGDAQGVTYLDHGECSRLALSARLGYIRTRLSSAKDMFVEGCCRVMLEKLLAVNHFDEPPLEPLQRLFNDYTSARSKAFTTINDISIRRFKWPRALQK